MVNFQESTTILNACTKKSGILLKAPHMFNKAKCKLHWLIKNDQNLLHDNVQPHFAGITLQKLTEQRLSYIHHILLIPYPLITIFSNIWTLFYAKKHSKVELKTAFNDFGTLKPLRF